MIFPKKKAFLFILSFFISFYILNAQTYKWEQVTTFPDTGVISEDSRVFATDDRVYLYMPYNYKNSTTGLFSPSVYKSSDGRNFEDTGLLPDSIKFQNLKFTNGNYIYASFLHNNNPGNYTIYLRSSDGVTFEEITPLRSGSDWFSQRRLLKEIGVARDTVFGFASVYDENVSQYLDSVYIFTEDSWKAVWGSGYNSPRAVVISVSGALVLKQGTNYLVFNSFNRPPDAFSDTVMQVLQGATWVSGSKLISHAANSSSFYISDLGTGISDALPLPDISNMNNWFDAPVYALPDSSIIIQRNSYLSSEEPYYDPVTNQLYQVGNLVRFYRSYDYGQNWELVSSFIDYVHDPVPFYKNVYELNGKWYCYDGTDLIWSSSDKGITWVPHSFNKIRNISSFEMHDGGMLINNAYFSKDNGSTWSTIQNAFPGYNTLEIRHIKGLKGWLFSIPDPNDAHFTELYLYQNLSQPVKTAFNFGSSSLNYGFFHKDLLFYQYQGNILEARNLMNANIIVSSFDVDSAVNLNTSDKIELFADNNFIYAYHLDLLSVFHGLYRSSDMGQTWETILPPVENFRPVLNSTEYGEILITHMEPASGSNYNTQTFRLTQNGFEPVEARGLVQDGIRKSPFAHMTDAGSGNIYVWNQAKTETPELFYSKDNGDNFTMLPSEGVEGQIINLQENNLGEVYLATNRGIYKLSEEPVTSVKSPEASENVLQLFPNPANQYLTIHIPFSGRLQISDMAGIKVEDRVVEDGKFNIKLNNWNQGMYIIQLLGDDGKVYSGKLVTQN